MAGLADVLDALVTLYTGTPGIVTVRKNVPTVAPEDDDLPMLFFDVTAASTEATSHRRTLVWPIDFYLLSKNKGQDLAADLETAYPWPETLIGVLDQKVALGGLLAGSVRWPDPIMEDLAPILLLKRTYFGCILHPRFPVKVEKEFKV
jgi:hypothetical protein